MKKRKFQTGGAVPSMAMPTPQTQASLNNMAGKLGQVAQSGNVGLGTAFGSGSPQTQAALSGLGKLSGAGAGLGGGPQMSNPLPPPPTSVPYDKRLPGMSRPIGSPGPGKPPMQPPVLVDDSLMGARPGAGKPIRPPGPPPREQGRGKAPVKKMASGGLGLGIGSQLPVAQTPSSSRAPLVDTSERSKFGTGTMPPAQNTNPPTNAAPPELDLGYTAAQTPRMRAPVMPRRGSAQMMAEGGSVGSASKRADGCAQRGKTKGKMY